MCEQSIINARASVMVYDDNQKKWLPSGSSSGLSKVQIYHHQQNNTFRVVGRKLQDHEVVINCSILKGLKYNQATATFHQWRDSKFVYGLNFSNQLDAEAFARAMMHALEVLSGRILAPNGPPPLQNNTSYEEDMGYRTMTREDAAIMQQQQMNSTVISPQTPTSQNTPQSPPVLSNQQGHHRTSSAPPVPQPPPMSMLPQQQQQQQQQQSQQKQQQQQQLLPLQTQQPQNQIYPGGQMQAAPNGYGTLPAMPTYNNQPIYVASNQNQSIGPPPPPMQLIQQQPQQQMVNQQGQQMQNGNIYAAATTTTAATSIVSNSMNVLYAVQQTANGQQQPPPAMNGGNNYGQTNGSYVNPQYGAPSQSIPPQVPQSNGPPMAPPPPPAFGAAITNSIQPHPPAPPMPPSNSQIDGAPPPPPPPPGNNMLSKSGGEINALALQLQQAKLKKSQKTPPPASAISTTVTENSGSSTSSGGSGNYGTIGRSTTGMASMMDEMAKTLARRRAQVEKKDPDPVNNGNDDQVRQRPWDKANTLPHKLGNNNGNLSSGNISGSAGSESPKSTRKRFGSASEETILKQVNGENFSISNSVDLENLKAEILREMRNEIARAKQEIIEAIKSEFNRR